MAEKPRLNVKQSRAVERIREAESMPLDLPVVGHVRIPHPDRLAFYAGLAALAAFSLLDWPVAVVLAVGHALSENHHSRVARELGEVLEEA
ncbi:MAG: hypothetical protein JO152_16180 [Mycobacteriaceae bacterium]|nr:hypothetical protein [Mycobacteriaceae bacterium]